MPTSHTITTIWNLALDLVGELPVQSHLNPTNAEGRWLARNYDHTVEMLLRSNPWNFAIEMSDLEPDSDFTGNSRWQYRYSLPNGWLRVLPLTYDGRRGGMPIVHEVKGNKLWTSYSGPRPVEIIMNVRNPGEWDPLFAETVRTSLAMGMAQKFTGKNSYLQLATQMHEAALELAQTTNAIEGSIAPVEAHDVIRVRGSYDT